MSQPFIGEIRMFGFNYPPRGWALCNGQLLSISQSSTLFAIIGTYYGGDGRTTFALPKLEGRAPMHWGTAQGLTPHQLGEANGSAFYDLIYSELPKHKHTMTFTKDNATSTNPQDLFPSKHLDNLKGYMYKQDPDLQQSGVQFAQEAISTVGSSQRHENRQPYLTVNFCIATEGLFPTRN